MPWFLKLIIIFSGIAIFCIVFSFFLLYGKNKRNRISSFLWLKVMTLMLLFFSLAYPMVSIINYYYFHSSWRDYLVNGSSLFDLFLIYPFWIAGITAVYFFLIAFIYLIVAWILRKNNILFQKINRYLVLVFALFFIYIPVKTLVDSNRVLNKRIQHTSTKTKKPLKIAHISDIQMDGRSGEKKIRAYIEEVNRQNVDLIFFSGDLVTSGSKFIPQAVKLLATAKSRYGTFACFGDHDFNRVQSLMKREFQRNKVFLLDNQTVTIDTESAKIHIAGFTNIYRNRPDYSLYQQLSQPSKKNDLKILLTHQPSDELVEMASSEYDLFLAGHTHGGQIKFTFFGLEISGSSFESSFIEGFYQKESMLISVNPGLGYTLAPIRFNAIASVYFIEIN